MVNNLISKEPSGVLLIDKPAGCSSFAIVHKVRKALGVKKVGHAGTLDPFATGLLILLVGSRWTKSAHAFSGLDKSYRVLIELGRSTTTYDPEGAIVAESTYVPSHEEVKERLLLFTGEIDQVPPMFSAKKVGGKRLYELARKGQTIERKPVRVKVDPVLKRYEYPDLELDITCSKGTYIRSFGYDFAKALSIEGHVKKLRRTACGPFSLEQALTLDEFLKCPPIAQLDEENVWPFVKNPLSVLHSYQPIFPRLQENASG